MSIALLCPSRGRPDKCRKMWISALQTAYDPGALSLHLGLIREEVNHYGAVAEAARHYPSNVIIREMKDWGFGFSVNLLAHKALQHSDVTLCMAIGDDTVFTTPGWDKALLDHYTALENKIHVYSLRDSRDENGTPHPIGTRAYIETMGYFMPPLFMHWYVDTWTVEIAKRNNCFTHLKDYMLLHEKDSDNGQPDETYNRIRIMGWRERDAFVDGASRHILGYESRRLRNKITYGDIESIMNSLEFTQ